MRTLLLISLFLISSLVDVQGQAYTSESKKAIKRFEEALELFRDGNPDEAKSILHKAIAADENFVEAYQLLSQLCYDDHRLEEAIGYYSRGLEIDPEGNPEGYRLLAGLEVQRGGYEPALELLETYFNFPAEKLRFPGKAFKLRQTCHFALEAMANPVPFEPLNLGPGVNSPHSEYWPSLSVDEEKLMFTVLLPLDSTGKGHQEDLFISERDGGTWGERRELGPPLNSPDNEGAQSMTAGGEMLFFTACNRRDGSGQCDIYTALKGSEGWSRAINLGKVLNSRYSEKHPSISADGRVLYFASNRPGGKGSYDIWSSEWKDGAWSSPVNLGDSVNTPGMEQSPFIHPDQQSLYYSSDGWPGLGRGDLFLSRMMEDGTWAKARNLGYPINTHSDEIGLSVNARGNRAYFASDRDGGRDTDIYTFEMPEARRPMEVSYFHGRVYDSRNMKGLEARISLTDLQSNQVMVELFSSRKDGSFLVPLPAGKDYALNASSPGYLFHSAHFPLGEEHSQLSPFRKNIPMEKIKAGSSMDLNNIFFESSSDSLLRASLNELEKVSQLLQRNPEIRVEIRGHTDNTGSASFNQKLSELRAQAVVNYLVEKGIAPGRLMASGAGDKEPLADNDSEKGKALNRRTELRIL